MFGESAAGFGRTSITVAFGRPGLKFKCGPSKIAVSPPPLNREFSHGRSHDCFFAIYFILPPLILFVAAYLTADIFVIVGEMTAETEIKREAGVTAMGVLITLALFSCWLTHWSTGSLTVSVVIGLLVYFAAGVMAYTLAHEDFRGAHGKMTTEPIELKRGIFPAALLSLITVVPSSVVVLVVMGR